MELCEMFSDNETREETNDNNALEFSAMRAGEEVESDENNLNTFDYWD